MTFSKPKEENRGWKPFLGLYNTYNITIFLRFLFFRPSSRWNIRWDKEFSSLRRIPNLVVSHAGGGFLAYFQLSSGPCRVRACVKIRSWARAWPRSFCWENRRRARYFEDVEFDVVRANDANPGERTVPIEKMASTVMKIVLLQERFAPRPWFTLVVFTAILNFFHLPSYVPRLQLSLGFTNIEFPGIFQNLKLIFVRRSQNDQLSEEKEDESLRSKEELIFETEPESL